MPEDVALKNDEVIEQEAPEIVEPAPPAPRYLTRSDERYPIIWTEALSTKPGMIECDKYGFPLMKLAGAAEAERARAKMLDEKESRLRLMESELAMRERFMKGQGGARNDRASYHLRDLTAEQREARDKRILEIIKGLDVDDKSLFTQQGIPTVEAINNALNGEFDILVNKQERDWAWEDILEGIRRNG